MKAPSDTTLAIIGWPLGIGLLVAMYLWPTTLTIGLFVVAALLVLHDNHKKRKEVKSGTEDQHRAR